MEHHRPPAQSPSPLLIAVIGVGGIGSTFAFQLAGQGHQDVTVIARPNSARLRQLQRDEAIVNIQGQSVKVRVSDTLDEAVPYDLVIVTLLAHQVDAVVPALGRSATKCIQFMFNQFEPERLLQAVGAGRGSFGMPFVQASLDGNGRLSAKIGVGGQKSKMNVAELPPRLFQLVCATTPALVVAAKLLAEKSALKLMPIESARASVSEAARSITLARAATRAT